ncbi:MAG: hypothetical protein ACYC3X_15120 [Pirellulaceae bacterium]
MTFIIGTDEAGYGPNLGPLVITATMWQVPLTRAVESLPDYLASIEVAAAEGATPLLGDSKRLYAAGRGLAALERGVLAALTLIDGELADVTTWRSLFQRLDPECLAKVANLPWHATYDCRLPVDAEPLAITSACSQLVDALAAADIRLIGMQSRIVFPAEFNARVSACESKGTALSLWTLELVRQLMGQVAEAPFVIQCDKHGGRNRYAALLQHLFPDSWIEVREESRLQSVYRWGLDRSGLCRSDPSAPCVEARFVAKGERFLPSALASMTAKYVRELAMQAFNAFWAAHMPGLQPTAGYPVDARRFVAEIRPVQQQLHIPDEILWRTR